MITTAFSSFFNDKFEKVPHHTTFYPKVNTIEEYVIQSTDSLYGAIAYIWYELFLKLSLTSIVFPNSAKSLLDNNVTELKKFVEMIKFME